MRAFPVIVLIGVCSLAVSAQSTEEDVNVEVWFPFIEAYNNLDGPAFMSVHTKDVVRVNRDGQRIRIGEEYAQDMISHFDRERQAQVRQEIDLRFLERFYSEDAGFEVGIYRVRRASGGQEQLFFGKFHVLLKKVDGTWKIAMDSDVSNNGMIREEDFMKAAPLPDR